MTIGFSQYFDKEKTKPTYFVEKIWSGLKKMEADVHLYNYLHSPYSQAKNILHLTPKIHTLRVDKPKRWEAGKLIHPVINNQTKDRLQFAPTIPCVSTQRVFMTYEHNDLIKISVDGKELFGHQERLQFAINDGFDTWQDFFDYFYPQIIANGHRGLSLTCVHWTDKRY